MWNSVAADVNINYKDSNPSNKAGNKVAGIVPFGTLFSEPQLPHGTLDVPHVAG